MGKSKKKINADKINILRKQYDAFLEEDKKRKERNEHILEKLDKIRLSNTLVRYKPNVYLEQRVTFSDVGETPNNAYTDPQNNQPTVINSIRKYKEALIPPEMDVLAKPLDEAYIIKEISKKYILIPKLRSNVGEEYIPRGNQNNNNDNDWKSKYSILDKLKQNEKEGTIDHSTLNSRGVYFSDDIPNREPKYRVGDEEVGITPTRDVEINDIYAKSNPNVPNSLMSLGDKGKIKLDNFTVNAEKDETIASERQSDTSPKSAVSRELQLNQEFTNKNNTVGTAEAQQIQSDMNSAEYTYPVTDVKAPTPFKNSGDQQNDAAYNDKHENEATEKKYSASHDISDVEVVGPIKPTVQETSNENRKAADFEKLEYPIDIINVPDFTPADNVTLVDGVNINPDVHDAKQAYLESIQHKVSDPTASNEQAYLPGANYSLGCDQNISEPTVRPEQAYLPEANHNLSSEEYASEPTGTAEEAYLPDTNDSPSGDQYISEQPVSTEQAYSEPVAVAAEHKDNAMENTEQQITDDPNMVDTMASEIKAFETEQNQMFYSEQENYQDYNQGAVGDVYNPENTGYDPALYYEGIQHDMNPVEINEHEETDQRYDPSYEQQYGGKGEEQQYEDQQQYAEPQQYEQQQYAEEQQYGEQPYVEQQQYGDQQPYVEQQQYDEQLHGEQQYLGQQQYGEQLQSELGVISTAHGYDQGQNDAVNEQQAIEEIEQQLDDEELTVPTQEGNLGDVVDESVLYTHNPNDAAPAES